MNRFLINLRSLDHSGISSSGLQNFSQFSTANFRVPDSTLGNVRQHLEYNVVHANEDEDLDIIVSGTSEGDLEHGNELPITEPSRTRPANLEATAVDIVCLLKALHHILIYFKLTITTQKDRDEHRHLQ
jgi:hypothetical protein